jgi:hypothetical protein
MNTLSEALKERACEQTSNSAGTLEAALLLLAFDNIPQCIILIHQALEMTFKSYIGEREPELLNILNLFNPDDIDLFYEKLETPRPEKDEIGCNFDIDKNSGHLLAALEVIDKRYDLKISKSKIKRVNKFRNDIVHQGGQGKINTSTLIKSFITGGWQQLSVFYREAYQIELCDHFFFNVKSSEIDAELTNILSYLKQARQDSFPTNSAHGVVSTLIQSHMITGIGHAQFDHNGELIDNSDYEHEINEHIFRELDKEWECLLEHKYHLHCKICHDLNVYVGVKLDEVDWDNRTCHATQIYCRNCGLSISEKYQHLAKLHFGKISEDDLGDTFEMVIPH